MTSHITAISAHQREWRTNALIIEERSRLFSLSQTYSAHHQRQTVPGLMTRSRQCAHVLAIAADCRDQPLVIIGNATDGRLAVEWSLSSRVALILIFRVTCNFLNNLSSAFVPINKWCTVDWFCRITWWTESQTNRLIIFNLQVYWESRDICRADV